MSFRTPSLLGLALAFSVAAPVHAQQDLLGPGALYLSAGVASVATSDLDDRLSANGYPTFGQSAGSGGLGIYRIVNSRILLGAEFNGLVLDKKAHNGREVNEGGGYATLGVGYMKELSSHLRVYPRLGLGAGGISLWMQSADTLTFDQVLTTPLPAAGRERILTRDGAVIDLGAGLEYLPGQSGILLGVRAGYLLSSFGSSSSWWMNDGTATGGPSASITGAYVRFVIGGAWKK